MTDVPQPADTPRPLLLGGENYPIIVDRGGGSGEKFDPYTPADARDYLAPQVATLREEVAELEDDLRGENVVFEAKLLANYLAGSHYPSELVRQAGLELVGTRNASGRLLTRDSEKERPTKTLLLAGPDASIDRLGELLERQPRAGRDRLWESLVRLDEVRLTPPENVIRRLPDDPGEGELFTWEAVLHPQFVTRGAAATHAQREMLQKWEALINRVAGEVDLDDRRVIDGLTFVPVALTIEALAHVTRFNPLRCLRIMPTIRVSPVPVRRGTSEFTLEPPDAENETRTDARIAIFDGGVDDTCPFIQPYVRQRDLTSELPADADILHGTAVTTTVLFGYPQRNTQLPQPYVGVDHYRVLPLPPVPSRAGGRRADDVDRQLYWLLDQIEHEVRTGDYRVVNLSIGPKSAVDEDGEPDAWTSTLDTLAREKNVLFVTAAGNDGTLDEMAGLHRVQVPADMVNGLGVGACTGRAHTPAGREIDRCEYSSRGPGRWGARVQPAGVAFGGLLPDHPFVAVLPHGVFGLMEGTSFATPLVTHGLTELIAAFGEERVTPELLRAFAIHFAERRARKHDPDHHGYGRLPENYHDLWRGGPDRATVLYEDALRRDGVAGFRLPLPDDLPTDAKVEIWWTVCVTAPISPRDSVEYTKAGFELLFRPHSRVFSFTNPDTKQYLGEAHVDNEPTQVRRFLRAGGVQSKMPVSKSAPRKGGVEQGRREAGKWETAIQQRFSRLQAARLHHPSLELKYIAREGGTLTRDAEALPFSMLVSVRIHGTQAPYALYDQVLAEFPQLVRASPVETEAELEI